jgi:hypothetical protein
MPADAWPGGGKIQSAAVDIAGDMRFARCGPAIRANLWSSRQYRVSLFPKML